MPRILPAGFLKFIPVLSIYEMLNVQTPGATHN
jgi:hypothetical protein